MTLRWLPLVCIAAGALAAQPPPARSLSAADARYAESFTEITGVRELRDGRVIVLDRRDLAIKLIDLAAGTARSIGRTGGGPGEYRMPLRLLAMGGDSSAIEDMAGYRRLLIIEPNGEPGGFLGLPKTENASNPEATDGRGRLYAYHYPGRPGERPASPLGHIVRWDPASGRSDTMAAVSRRVVTPLPPPTRPGPPPPFSTWEQWAVAQDGRVAVVSVEPYRVTFFHPDGTRTVGPPVRVDPIPVSEAHKRDWRERAQRPVPTLVANGRGETETRFSKPRFSEPEGWPKVLPPFLPDAVWFASDGRLWVQRTAPAGAAPSFDLIDQAGAVVARLQLPPRTRVVGFGRGVVYLARIDDDDLEYLERYGLPPN